MESYTLFTPICHCGQFIGKILLDYLQEVVREQNMIDEGKSNGDCDFMEFFEKMGLDTRLDPCCINSLIAPTSRNEQLLRFRRIFSDGILKDELSPEDKILLRNGLMYVFPDEHRCLKNIMIDKCLLHINKER